MKLAFVPGQLFLLQLDNSTYVVTLQEREVLRSKSKKVALARFNELRRELEQSFPTKELSDAEKTNLLHREIAESLVGHNSLGGRKKSKSASKTRTFGG
ncbi:MAG: hypothetical protein ACRD2L_23405 [Terriglobia bacterium]